MRSLVPALLVLLPGAGLAAPIDGIEQMFGATPLIGVSGNGRLTAGITPGGELAVLRWPSTTHWDHLRYQTSAGAAARDEPRLGARENDGGLWGVYVPGRGLAWLRDAPWERSSRYSGPTSPALVTTYDHPEWGLTLVGTDVVLPEADVLVRRLEVTGGGEGVRLVHYVNLALHTDHRAFLPNHEYVADDERPGRLRCDPAAGTAAWTLPEGAAGVALSLGGSAPLAGCQCGWDRGLPGGPEGVADGYDDAADGELDGVHEQDGLATLALAWDAGAVTLLIAAGEDEAAARAVLDAHAGREWSDLLGEAEAWWAARLAEARLPATEDPDELAFAQRTLVALLTGVDRETAAIVASAASQPPYHLDWPRDGAFFNAGLDLAGYPDLVRRHNEYYASIQRTEDGQDRFGTNDAPAGSWAMNYYADGTPGGPIDFEIDQVGLLVWTMVAHARREDDAHLRSLWPAIRRAADLLTDCRDEEVPALQCPANEDDNLERTRTLHGAETVLLALRAAAEAAARLGEDEEAERWKARAGELQAAIEEHLWDADAGHFSADGIGQNSWAVWPVRLWPWDDPRWEGVVTRLLDHVRRKLLDADPAGSSYDAKALIALACLLPDPGDPRRETLREALHVLTTEVPTRETRHLGEVYLPLPDDDGDGRPDGWSNRTSQPHLWDQTLSYLALLEFYEPGTLDELLPSAPAAADTGGGCGCQATGDGRGGLPALLLLALALVACRATPVTSGRPPHRPRGSWCPGTAGAPRTPSAR